MNLSKIKKLPISAVIVIYNEEKLLERALKSFYDLVDEIIIVHDGKCLDKSLEIAGKYTKKIYIRSHIGDAEPQRPFTYGKARNDWILQLDADEFLSEPLKKNLDRLIKGDIDAYDISWPIVYKGKKYFWQYKRALFKKSRFYFLGAPHEYPKPINKDVKIKKVDYSLMNEPDYENLSWKAFKTKWIKWAKIQAKQYSVPFSKIPKWNYELKDWDYPTNMRIKYPIIYGMILTPGYHMLQGFKNMLKYKSFYYIKQEFFTSLYFIAVFYNLKFNNE